MNCPECGAAHKTKKAAHLCFLKSGEVIDHCIVSGKDPGDEERNRCQRMTGYYNKLSGTVSVTGIPWAINQRRIAETMRQFNDLPARMCRKALVYQHKDMLSVDIPITRDIYLVYDNKYDKHVAVEMGRVQIFKIRDVKIENMTKRRRKINPLVEICFILSNADMLRFLLYEGE